MWLGWESFIIFDVLVKVGIVIAVFIFYVSLAFIAAAILTYLAGKRKPKSEEKEDSDDITFKKAS